MRVTDFDFNLPPELIASRPAETRDECRLMVLQGNGELQHKRFYDLPEYLNKGDMLLLNNTKVFPARLTMKKQSGGRLEALLVRETAPCTWEILSRERYSGRVILSDNIYGEMLDGRALRFEPEHREAVRAAGLMPLPPYIKRKPADADREWYQTVYAEKEGSIAAPTAGLHFTNELISGLEQKGVLIRSLTLHVGTGTFRPVKVEQVKDHLMDREYFEINRNLIKEIHTITGSGKRLVAVGTTATRAIEGYLSGRWSETEKPESGIISGYTDIFIYPGYRFRAVASLITNFHLPGSTPLMLTSAFCGGENLLKAYRKAIDAGYGFFSYGDAMLIL